MGAASAVVVFTVVVVSGRFGGRNFGGNFRHHRFSNDVFIGDFGFPWWWGYPYGYYGYNYYPYDYYGYGDYGYGGYGYYGGPGYGYRYGNRTGYGYRYGNRSRNLRSVRSR